MSSRRELSFQGRGIDRDAFQIETIEPHARFVMIL